MSELRSLSKLNNLGPALDVKILFNQIAVNFDYNPRLLKCMKNDNWNNCLKMLDEILDTLMKNENIEANAQVLEDDENVSDPKIPYKVSRKAKIKLFEKIKVKCESRRHLKCVLKTKQSEAKMNNLLWIFFIEEDILDGFLP